MRITGLIAAISLSIIATASNAQSRDSTQEGIRLVNLNSIVVKSTGIEQTKNKPRILDAKLVFASAASSNSEYWDSTYLLTRFLPPADKDFKISIIEGRLADFDTTKLNVHLVMVQFNGADTFIKEIPIALGPGQRRKDRYVMSVRDAGILLRPAPFYLGYSLHTRPVQEEYKYRFYCTTGGEGAMLRRREGNWRYATGAHLPYIFPFSISYLRQ